MPLAGKPIEVVINKPKNRGSNVVEPTTERGRMARQRLLDAAEAVLNRLPYSQVRISDITNEAGTAFGLFYRYFADQKALVMELVLAMMHQFDPMLEVPSDSNGASLLERIRIYQRINVDNHIHHPGLIRAAPDVAMEDADFRRKIRSLHMNYIEHMVGKSIPGWELDADDLAKAHRRMRILAVHGMSVIALQDYYVWKTAGLRQLRLSANEIADWLSVLCFRALTGRNPDVSGFPTLEKIRSLM